MKSGNWIASVVVGASLVAGAFAASAQEQLIPSMVYRTGPYAPSGTPTADGFHDYITLLNNRDGGQHRWEQAIEPDEKQARQLFVQHKSGVEGIAQHHVAEYGDDHDGQGDGQEHFGGLVQQRFWFLPARNFFRWIHGLSHVASAWLFG